MKKEMTEGYKLPKGYGISYFDYQRKYYICYPIIINLIVRWSRSLYFSITRNRLDWIDEEIYKAYERGFSNGIKFIYKDRP